MGYQTDFEGQIDLVPSLNQDQIDYLDRFAKMRRMKRDIDKLRNIDVPLMNKLGLSNGPEGAFVVLTPGAADQEHVTAIDYNHPPEGQPGLWCQWVPARDGKVLEWDGNEKFYNYIEWMKYIIDNFLKPWGIVANGSIEWRGEDHSDIGRLVVENNRVGSIKVKGKKITQPIKWKD